MPAQIIYPRGYSPIRSEKSRSIRNAQRDAFKHGRHSLKEKICHRPTILKGLPCYPSTVAMKSTHLTKYFDLNKGRSNTVEMKRITPSTEQPIFQVYHCYTTRVLRSTVHLKAHQAVQYLHPSPSRHCYRNTASYKSVYQCFPLGTARITAHLCRLR